MARKDRTYVVDDLTELGDLDRAAVREALADLESIGHREGGAFIVAPVRTVRTRGADEIVAGVDEFRTRGWVIRHTYAPHAELLLAEPAAEVELEAAAESMEFDPLPEETDMRDEDDAAALADVDSPLEAARHGAAE